MTTYVHTLAGPSRVAHLGTGEKTLCGQVLRSFYRVTAHFPADRRLCLHCEDRAESKVRRNARVHRYLAQRDAAFAALLKEGLGNGSLVRRTGLGLRTVSRYVNEAIYRAGVRSRFQWGYKLGYDAGLRDGLGYAKAAPGVWRRG